jgi:hypothetical protein
MGATGSSWGRLGAGSRRQVSTFPAALEAFPDLAAADSLELLATASDPETAAGLSRNRIVGALMRARRRDVAARPSRSTRCCAPTRCASPRSWPAPTR